MDTAEFKESRLKLGFSQQELANELGITKRQLANFESGKSEIKPIYDEKISSLLQKNQQVIDNSNSYTFPLLNIKASAGTGIQTYKIEVIDNIILDKSFFKTTPNVENIKIIEVLGDSMYPTLHSGDYVLIDESRNSSIDGIYALNLHNQILIKRLKFKLDGTIAIISDNEKYENEIYNPNETQIPLHIIGMKILTIQR